VGVQVRWDGGGTEPAREYKFFYGKGTGNHELGTGFFLCIRESIISYHEEIKRRLSPGNACYHLV
jgi:hypothetical protein